MAHINSFESGMNHLFVIKVVWSHRGIHFWAQKLLPLSILYGRGEFNITVDSRPSTLINCYMLLLLLRRRSRRWRRRRNTNGSCSLCRGRRRNRRHCRWGRNWRRSNRRHYRRLRCHMRCSHWRLCNRLLNHGWRLD